MKSALFSILICVIVLIAHSFLSYPAYAANNSDDIKTIDDCISDIEGGNHFQCIGKVRDNCLIQNNVRTGNGGCNSRERAAWDVILNDTYKQLLKARSKDDASNIKQTQRDILAISKDKCELAVRGLEGTNAAENYLSECQMKETALNTLWMLGLGQ